MILRRKHIAIVLSVFFMTSMALLSCSRESDQEDVVLKQVDMAISVGSLNVATKADITDITELDVDSPAFRGMTDVHLVAFDKAGQIESTDVARSGVMELHGVPSVSKDVHAYLYASGIDAWLPTGTASMLMYGRAPGEGTDAITRHRYGALREVGFHEGTTRPSASSLGFEPYMMFRGDIPEEAQTIARTLNHILLGRPYIINAIYNTDQSEVVSVNWNENTGDRNLRKAFLQIMNDGDLIPGSGGMVEDLLTDLYHILVTFESYNTNVYEIEVNGVYYEASKKDGTPLLYKDLYNGLRDELLSRFRNCEYLKEIDPTEDPTEITISFKQETVRDYPETVGLPSGCAVLRWTPTGFVVPQFEGVEGMAPMTRYCFPPALYYYTNTTIKTSNDKNIRTFYDEAKEYTKWSQVLAHYTLGSVISSSTTSIALENPLHFGVALMGVTVNASRRYLPDNDDLAETLVDASGDHLPVRGVILGSQYAQNFDFTPSYSDDGECFLYDDQIFDIFLTSDASEGTSGPFYTLSLQTPNEKDVYFCLELENKTGDTFYGADGRILPNRKFYMVGKLSMPSTPRAFDSVFVQDHLTSVTCTIHSLEGAYNSIPDLGMPQLVIGVQTKVNWDLSSPTTVMME